MRKIVIVGATSAIAEATCRLFAENGDSLYLIGRGRERLDSISKDLKIRGANEVHTYALDMSQINKHKKLLESAELAMGGMDILFVAYGTLPDQKDCEESINIALREFNTNCTSVISILGHAANIFQSKNKGHIVAITSVAGDRGRKSNYLYGSAKGATSIFLQGLRNRLNDNGVTVTTIKPGLVDTPMTKSFSKNFLWESPEKIAQGIFKAIDNRCDVVYLPWFWRYIMLAIKLMPEKLFKTLSL